MGEHDRPHERNPDNVILWRLTALEEAMKYQSGQLVELRDRLDKTPERLAREFPTRLELQRDYVRQEDVRQQTVTTRDVWTLRLLALGTVGSCVLGAIELIHTLAG